jgi:hypothetical protein|tara:strand:- start:886 stop:2688 length:1803 start_codon:yes stop_codon:yes gene_type:complete
MLLTENRVSQVKEKYNIPAEVWEPMVSGSAAIAKNQKYLEWIARVWSERVSTPEYIETQKREGHIWSGVLNGTLSTIEEFDRVRPNLQKKDLYQYRDRQEVIDALESWEKEKTRNIDTHKESEVVFEDSRFKVVVPKSHAASCYYGAGTKWCTASKDATHHFTNYDKDGKLFYILDKSAPTSNKYYKVALNKTYKGGNTYYDAKDSVIADPEDIYNIMSNKELMETVDEYFKFTYADELLKISEEEKQRELERIAREAEWARRRREREQRLEQTVARRRGNQEWSGDDMDNIGIMANALMSWLIEEEEFEDKKIEILDVEDQIEDLRGEMDNDPEVIADPSGQRAQDYGEDLNNLEEEIEVLKQEAHDVYDLRYDDYDHYVLPVFEYEGAEYAIGDEQMADDAAWEQVESLIDDVGYNGFAEGFAEWYVDGDLVADDFYDMFWEDMYDSPEDYLDEEEDTELTSDAKKELENIDENIGNFMEELEETDDELMREEIEDKISYLQSEKEEIEEDEDNYEFTEEAKESYVENRMQEVRDGPMEFLRDYGWDTAENLERYIDKDNFIQAVLDGDGRGNGLSSYDGNENEVSYDGEWYYIYRIN